MSASDLKPGTTNAISAPASQAMAPSEPAASTSTTHHKDEIEPQALELLREFFLLLDQWDWERQR
jgi:hypothetical protein